MNDLAGTSEMSDLAETNEMSERATIRDQETDVSDLGRKTMDETTGNAPLATTSTSRLGRNATDAISQNQGMWEEAIVQGVGFLNEETLNGVIHSLEIETEVVAETLVEIEVDVETLVEIVDAMTIDAIQIVAKMTGIVNVEVEGTNGIKTAPMGKPTNVIGRHGENALDMLTTGAHAQFNHAVIKAKIETTEVNSHDSRRALS
tara:strand:+ start:463 stop:1074 length:612 start_codon:yes stop_codon:yes gene_type:complete